MPTNPPLSSAFLYSQAHIASLSQERARESEEVQEMRLRLQAQVGEGGGGVTCAGHAGQM